MINVLTGSKPQHIATPICSIFYINIKPDMVADIKSFRLSKKNLALLHKCHILPEPPTKAT